MTDKGATAPQVSKEIDEERGSDNKSYPGAAPLGTDAEAGGNAATREELKIAREQTEDRGEKAKD